MQTGSTTLASIVFRHAARHGLETPNVGLIEESRGKREKKVASSAKCREQPLKRCHDAYFAHLTNMGGKFNGAGNSEYIGGINATNAFYQGVLDGTAEKRFFHFTLLRNPADRLRSHFDYYFRSTRWYRGSFESWLKSGHDEDKREYQCTEIGLYSDEHARHFVATHLATPPPVASGPPAARAAALGRRLIDFVMVTEKMDVCLLLLRRMLARLGWDFDLLDLLHLSNPMSVNWMSNDVVKSDLPDEQRATIMARNPRDAMVWEAATAFVGKLVQREKDHDGDAGALFALELDGYRLLQKQLKAACAGTQPLRKHIRDNVWSKATTRKVWVQDIGENISHSLCHWYMMEDSTYVNFVHQTGGNVHGAYSTELEDGAQGLEQQVLRSL